MFNKALVFLGTSIAAILIVENMVVSSWTAFILIWYWKVWTLVIISILVWGCIWYWLKWMRSEKDIDNDELDF